MKSLLNKIWDLFAKPLNKFGQKHPVFWAKNKDFIASCICGFLGALCSYLMLNFIPNLFPQEFNNSKIFDGVKIEINEHFSYFWKPLSYSSVVIVDGQVVSSKLGLGYTITYYLTLVVSGMISLHFMRKYYHSTIKYKTQLIQTFSSIFVVAIISTMINNLWLPIINYYTSPFVYNFIVIVVVGFINLIIGHIMNKLIFDEDLKNKRKNKKTKALEEE